VEAHAVDEWPISSARFNMAAGQPYSEPVSVPQPGSDAERCRLARAFVTDFRYPGAVLVDPVSTGSPFESAYACWPFRFFGVSAGGVLRHVAHPKDCSYDVVALRDWLLAELA